MKSLPRSTPAVILGVAALMLLTTTGGAVAGSLITSKQIKNGTITGADIKDKAVGVKDLAPAARAATGATGPAGPAGPAGAAGAAGPRGYSAWDVIPSGTTVVGEYTWDAATTGNTGSDAFIVDLPGVAPTALTSTTVGFKSHAAVVPADVDPACTGTPAAPTAPPGKVCLYVIDRGNVATVYGDVNSLPRNSFIVYFNPSTNTAGLDEYLTVSWAYTAP
jgi:hypothetical protein